jgi:hypothetical protein
VNRPTITIPFSLLKATSIEWDIDWRGQPPSDRTDGSTQVVFNAFPRWVGSLDLRLTRDFVRHWRALHWAAQGRVGIYQIPMFDPVGFDQVGYFGKSYVRSGVPFSSGQRFSSGYGFAANATVEASAPASIGASEITVKTTDADLVPRVGQIMSANDWPMGITSVTDNGDDTYTLGIQMPLRAAISSGDLVRCMARGLFEVANDREGSPVYDIRKLSETSITFREVLSR